MLHFNHSQLSTSLTWQTLGLTQMPFMPSFQYAMLYTPKAWVDLLVRMQNFLTSTVRLLILSAPKGMGKTTFLHYFLNDDVLSVKKIQLQARTLLTPQSFNEQLIKAFRLPVSIENAEHQQTQLDHILKAMRMTKERYLLMIDDATLLPLPVLATILHLLMQSPSRLKFQVILFGLDDLKSQLSALLARDAAEFPVLRLTLRPLTLTECRHYLIFRLQKAGLDASFQLDEDSVKKIFQLSQGVPGVLNVLAQTFLEEGRLLTACGLQNQKVLPVSEEPFLPIEKEKVVPPYLQPISLALVLLGCLALWHYQDRVDDKIVASHSVTPVLITAFNAHHKV